jgi:hypothetical protein
MAGKISSLVRDALGGKNHHLMLCRPPSRASFLSFLLLCRFVLCFISLLSSLFLLSLCFGSRNRFPAWPLLAQCLALPTKDTSDPYFSRLGEVLQRASLHARLAPLGRPSGSTSHDPYGSRLLCSK